MTPAPQPQQDRCVLTRHDVQSIKDLVFIIGGNSESSTQKAIFEILANNMRRSRPHTPAPNYHCDRLADERLCSYRGETCRFKNKSHCSDYIKCTCELCQILRVPKEMECFGIAYQPEDEMCQLCRASEECRKFNLPNKTHDATIRNATLDEMFILIKDKCEFMFGVLPYNDEVKKETLYRMINSLRTPITPKEQP